MRGVDNPTVRVVAVLVLVTVLAAALRGYLPDPAPTRRDQDGGGSANPAFAVVLLGAALAIIAVSIVVRLRDRRARARAGDLSGLSEGAVGAAHRPSWRFLLIALAVILAWLLLVWLLAWVRSPHLFDPLDTSPQTTGTGPTAPPPETAPPPPPPRRQPDGNVFGYLAASASVLLLLIAGGVVAGTIARRRSPQPVAMAAGPSGSLTTGADSLVRAAELGLAEIGDLSRDPRSAIIACYATMERELSRLPDTVPQEYDTPTEVLARAVDHHALPADNAAQLVALFTEARFSAHVMTERHRQSAVDVLNLVLLELRSAS